MNVARGAVGGHGERLDAVAVNTKRLDIVVVNTRGKHQELMAS